MTTTTLTVPARQLSDIRAGDRIVAIDGYDVNPMTVEAPLGQAMRGGIKTVYDSPSGVERYLYVDTVFESVTVERDLSKPARKPRKKPEVVTVRRYGIPLLRKKGDYFTEDGRYRIFWNEGYVTSCEVPHPARITRDLENQVQCDIEYGNRGRHPWALIDAVMQCKNGYLCPGNVEHTYGLWCIWDLSIDDYVDYDTGGYSSLSEAAATVAALYPAPAGARP